MPKPASLSSQGRGRGFETLRAHECDLQPLGLPLSGDDSIMQACQTSWFEIFQKGFTPNCNAELMSAGSRFSSIFPASSGA
jgi:hypothetical protein